MDLFDSPNPNDAANTPGSSRLLLGQEPRRSLRVADLWLVRRTFDPLFMISHPQEHPSGVTFGLTDSEVADIRFAATHSLFIYLFGSSRFQRVVTAVIIFLTVSSFLQLGSHGWDIFSRPHPLLALFCLFQVFQQAAKPSSNHP